MKTIRELTIKDWSAYFFEEMVNILDIDPECFLVSDAKECTNSTMVYNLCYFDETCLPHIVFNNIDCYFKKSDTYSFLVLCNNDKNKAMISNHVKIIKELEDERFSYIDEFEDKDFIFGVDSARFRFKTGDNLVHNEKINIPVCVISLSSVIKKEWIYCPSLKLQKCL